MKTLTYCAAFLLLAAGDAHAASADGSFQLMVLSAALWLLGLGWIFLLMLRRKLSSEDRVTELEARLTLEQKSRALAEHALADIHAVLARLVHQHDQVREGERNRIARDIHDDLGQNLLALRIDLSLMQVATAGIHPAINQKVAAMGASLERAVRSLRAVINNLRPLALESGLRHALEAQLLEFTRVPGVGHQFEAAPGSLEGAARPAGLDAMLYRVVQESLSNVARHAGATEVRVALASDGTALTLRVQDNGVGMALRTDGAYGADGHGYGLSGMRARAAAAGGTLSVESAPGTGTVILVQVPLAQHASQH
ncbi:MAG TPA: ATP-binding protein [Telluria sp.]|nr:ATP-binding protein [Telluria sp.]